MELCPSVLITDGIFSSVIPLLFSGFLVVINLRGNVTRLGNIVYIAIISIYRIFVVGRAMLGMVEQC